jgi:hypothetical protein
MSGEDALKLATRDALLKLRDTLLGSFSKEVKRVVISGFALEASIADAQHCP